MSIRKESGSCGRLELLVPEAEAEAVCERLRELFDREPVALSRPGEAFARIECYFDSDIEAELARRALPPDLPVREAAARPLREEDWTTFWRRHFHVMEIGRRLRIVPEWERPPQSDRLDIIVRPGMSFGTGGHFTTRFCLETIERLCEEEKPASFIDAGTGSGILAVAAARLGIPRIEAFDFDPVCVEQARENVKRNGVADRVRVFQADVLDPSWAREPADVVCANILSSVLIEAAPLLLRAARRALVLSGIREVEADGVAETFRLLGGRETLRDGDGRWCGIVIRPPERRAG